MKPHVKHLLDDRKMAHGLALRGLRTILESRTCAHRVDALLGICRELERKSSETFLIA